jgi:hypothetical protein
MNEEQQKTKRLNFATLYLPPKFICKTMDIRSFASSLELNVNLARQHDLGIKVTNEGGRVDVWVEGTEEQLGVFRARRERIMQAKAVRDDNIRMAKAALKDARTRDYSVEAMERSSEGERPLNLRIISRRK